MSLVIHLNQFLYQEGIILSSTKQKQKGLSMMPIHLLHVLVYITGDLLVSTIIGERLDNIHGKKLVVCST